MAAPSWRVRLRRVVTRRRGLRARSAIAFAGLALVLSFTLAMVTYQLARSYLVGQRETLATRQVMVDALVAKGLVSASDAGPDDVLDSLRSVSNARAVLRVDGTWYAAVVELSDATIPTSLIAAVDANGSGRQRIAVNGVPYLVVGIKLPGLDATYYEFVSLAEYRRTLRTLATVLVVAASATTLLGAVAAWALSRRLVRPLAAVATAARAMSTGDLTRRLDVEHDRDLRPVAASFNQMAASLEQRIDRELRFTADVSHELRTPLTAMAAAVGLARRSDLSSRALYAVDVLDQQVDHLRRLTLELLEISSIDAGVAELRLTDVDVQLAVRSVLRSAGEREDALHSELGDGSLHRLDQVRFERIIANLVENAARYGGGVTSITLADTGGALSVIVDDAGPGVAVEDRTAIFGRFHRGAAPQPEDRPKGTGLGLALVDEHVRMHGGTVWVTDSPDGGARFELWIPQS